MFHVSHAGDIAAICALLENNNASKLHFAFSESIENGLLCAFRYQYYNLLLPLGITEFENDLSDVLFIAFSLVSHDYRRHLSSTYSI